MSNVTVESLRQQGFKVRVKQERLTNSGGWLTRREHENKIASIFPIAFGSLIQTKGGRTVVEITTPDGKNLVGEALCSKKDNFNRKTGLNLALERAMKQLAE